MLSGIVRVSMRVNISAAGSRSLAAAEASNQFQKILCVDVVCGRDLRRCDLNGPGLCNLDGQFVLLHISSFIF
jgi:hypothetical protein